jgi:transposase InsO family protein
MVKDYKKTKHQRMDWTDQTKQAYTDLQAAIEKCQLLHFLDDTSPIYVMTDASQYGIGAYMAQVVDGVEHPIAFYSKSLTPPQMRWTTQEQECFAIHQALTEWEYLLAGREFVLRCDHHNLQYINNSPSDKVMRWKLALQRLNYVAEHIQGRWNKCADWFSRLMRDPKERQQQLLAFAAMNRVALLLMHIAHGTDRKPAKATDRPRRRVTLAPLMAPGGIPDDKRALIQQAHNGVVGHNGVERTRQLLAQKAVYWPNMRAHVRQFVAECACCQKNADVVQRTSNARFTVSSSRPMARRAVDTLGPFPEDTDGNTCVVSIIDTFSRFVTLHACKDATAQTAVDGALLPHMGIFGVPEQLVSDNGTQFVNDLVAQLKEAVGMEMIAIAPYSHEENSLVERSHRETLRHLRALVYEQGTTVRLSTCLPLVQRIVNARPLKSIGCSPAELIFGKSLNLDEGIFLTFTANEQKEMDFGGHIRDLVQVQAVLIRKAQKLLKEHDVLHTGGAHDVTEYAAGSFVLVTYPPGPGGKKSHPPTKLHTNYKGPMRVVRHEGPHYYLHDLVRNKALPRPVHESRLVAFKYDPARTNPRDVARRDLREFFVHEVLNHRYKTATAPHTSSNMEFLVSWLGYDSDHNSWEPWCNLRPTKALHRYLSRVGMASKIPKEFRRADYDVDSDSEED